MPTIVNLDFRNAPPASGGGGADYFPPGDYRFLVAKTGVQKTKAGKDMIVLNVVVDGGDFDGSRLVDRFVLPAEEGDSLFPLQRFHAFLNAIGAYPGERQLNGFDLDRLINQRFLATVDDDMLEPLPNSNKPPKKITRIVDYTPKEQAVKAAAPTTNGTKPAAAKPAAAVVAAPVAAPVEPEVEDDEDDTALPMIAINGSAEAESEAEAEPEVVAVAAAPTARRRTVAPPPAADVEAEIDSLFG